MKTFTTRPLALFILGTFALLFPSQPCRAWGNGLALTPPLGWNSWNKFHCNVSEDLIKSMTDGMVSSGMKDAGFQYIVIDDCWQVSRDADGNIVSDPQRFPSGMNPQSPQGSPVTIFRALPLLPLAIVTQTVSEPFRGWIKSKPQEGQISGS